jgi:flagellar biosynthesis protein FlhG
MHDQASELRALVRKGTLPAAAVPSASPRLLVVGGGARGAGTTTIAVNLAVVLAQQRYRTVLVDLDPRGAACRLAGVEARCPLTDVLEGRRSVREELQPGPAGLDVFLAAWPLAEARKPPDTTYARLVEQLRKPDIGADFVVVDAGNRTGWLTQRFWQAAPMVLLVMTPEPASVMAAYASIKLLASERASGPDSSVVIHTLVNKAPRGSVARQVHARVAQGCLRFLGIEVGGAGFVADDPRVPAADRAGRPVVICTPRCTSARQVRTLVKTVVRRIQQPAVIA